MSISEIKPWESKRTPETRDIEKRLMSQFEQADAYRYNSASIRIRVIDKKFEGLSRIERDSLVEKVIDTLPPETQSDIVTLFTFAPSELSVVPGSFRESMQNAEFESPSPSML